MNSLETDVLRWIGESVTSPDVFSDITPVRDSINNALQEVCLLTGSYQQTYHLRMRADTYIYRTPWSVEHFGWVVECWDRSRQMPLGQIDLLSLHGMDAYWQQATGYPEYYFYAGTDKLGVYRAPSADGTVLEFTCVVVPRRYTTDDEPVKLRDQYQRATTYYAVGEYFASRGDAKRAVEWHTKYLETSGLQSIHPDHSERQWQLANKYNPRWQR